MIGYLTPNHPLIEAFVPAAAPRTRRESSAASRLIRSAPKLADFLPEVECTAVRGSLDRPISGLAIDSRRVSPGAVYFELPGRWPAGTSGLDEAMSRGAVAVVVAALPAVAPGRVTLVQVADVAAALARAAQRFYGFPDRAMSVVGVVGTHGKTTVAHLVKHLLNGDQRVGLIGSIHYELGQRTVPSFGSTPEALDIFGMMAQMRDAGCRHAVLELSEAGLAQQRVLGMHWGAAVLTNLGGTGTGDSAALRLLQGGAGRVPAISVVNVDAPAGRTVADRLAAEVPQTRVVTYGEHSLAEVRAENIVLGPRGASFRLLWPGGALEVESPLTGRGQVVHLLAAVGVAWGLGRDPLVVLARLRAFPGVPGRLERIDAGQAFSVWVDAANTPETLRHTLEQVRAVTPGRLLVVFGCSGNRDGAGRPAVTRVVQEFAGFAVATADNPRSEGVERIFADMRAGVTAPERIAWLADRRRAMELALAMARPCDAVVIAGRGHESYQEIADTVIPFDDRRVVRELLARGEE